MLPFERYIYTYFGIGTFIALSKYHTGYSNILNKYTNKWTIKNKHDDLILKVSSYIPFWPFKLYKKSIENSVSKINKI